MKGLRELIYEASRSNSTYKPGTVVPVMYWENGHGSAINWSLGYIRFDLNSEGELGAWFHGSRHSLDEKEGNYTSPARYVIVKFEDFDPMDDKKNIKNAFIKMGYGEAAGNFTIL